MDLMEMGDVGSGSEDWGLAGSGSGSVEDCLDQDCHWEESMFGLTELVCVTVIYIPLMLLGLLGNVLTILVVWLRPHMRSSTYLYLSSMAVSDLLILLLLPLDLYKLWRPRPWPLGDVVCKLTMFLSECCTFCTILHITFLSLERYLAVCWPITAKTLVTRRRTRALIGCLWLGAAVSAAPVLIMVGVEEVGGDTHVVAGWSEDGGWTGTEGFLIGGGGVASVEVAQKQEMGEALKYFGEKNDRKEPEEKGGEMEEERGSKKKEDEGGGGGRLEEDMRECRCTDYALSSGLLSAMMILSNLYFLAPLGILALVYSLIGRALWLRPQSSRRDQSHRHTVKMLGVIVLAFVLCWLPFHVGRTIFFLSLGSASDHHDAFRDARLHAQTPSNATVDSDHTLCDAHFRSTDTHLHLEVHNGTLICIQSQNNTPDHTPHAYTVTPVTPVTPVHLARNDSRYDDAYAAPDAHLYFLYYLSQYFNLASSVLFYLSAAVNPLLYNLMSARYRHAVHSLVHAHRQSPRLRTATTLHSTTTL